VREHRRPRRDHLRLDRRGRACLGDMAVAVGRALEPPVHHRAMSPRRQAAADPPRIDPEGLPAARPPAAKPKTGKPAAAKPPPAEKAAAEKPRPQKPAAEESAKAPAASARPASEPAGGRQPARKRRIAAL